MTVSSGRSVRISRAGVTVVGARTDSVTINNEPIDITDKDDAGWRTLLADVGLRSIDCEVEGVLKDDTLIAAAVGTATALLEACEVVIGDIGVFSGNFSLNNISIGAEQEGAMTFTASLQSAGAITATVGPYNTVLPLITVTGGADSGDLAANTGTWAGDATITFATVWQFNAVTTAGANHPGWTDAANEAAAETRHAAGDIVRVKVTASNSVGDTIAFSAAVT